MEHLGLLELPEEEIIFFKIQKNYERNYNLF